MEVRVTLKIYLHMFVVAFQVQSNPSAEKQFAIDIFNANCMIWRVSDQNGSFCVRLILVNILRVLHHMLPKICLVPYHGDNQ